MKTIRLNFFQVSLPEKYKVKKHYPYIMNLLFLIILCFKRIVSGLPMFIKMKPTDLESTIDLHECEVKMGEHSLFLYTEVGSKEPEDLAEFIQSQTKHLPVLEDVEYSGVKGKKYGSYSKEMSWIDWWLKKGNCIISLNFQGKGMPSDEIKEDVSNILNSLEYIS